MIEPGPVRGTPPRLCTTASKACCWCCGTLSRVAAGTLAILQLLLCACCVSLQQRSPTVHIPRAHHPLHGRRAHAATATALREVTCPTRAAAVRLGPAPDSAGSPA